MRPSEAAAFYYARTGISPSETPRERQVREMVARQDEDVNRARADLHRQRLREAKCALSGHRWDTTHPLWECLRCAALKNTEEEDA